MQDSLDIVKQQLKSIRYLLRCMFRSIWYTGVVIIDEIIHLLEAFMWFDYPDWLGEYRYRLCQYAWNNYFTFWRIE